MFETGYGGNIIKKISVGFCCLVDYGIVICSICIALVVLPEVSVSLFTLWASGSMIFILYRHKQQIQHIHTKNVSLRSPESRVTQSILLLVITFISFHTLSTTFRISMTVIHKLNSWLLRTSEVISLCFPAISPFLIMSQDSSSFRHYFSAQETHNISNDLIVLPVALSSFCKKECRNTRRGH